ncbi:MAG: prepilin-type N-terminal cleavage/methylation domain-containing protein [Phycisphaerae bacterium]|nr:prepilin-type N-terminal cleavage/methylation domain-containing protein [Phycisphaerae bacterium]
MARKHGRWIPHGFTLVELLVVISIIALLISILLPSLSRARDQAKTVKCLAHERGLAQAGFVFTGDHNGRFQLSATEGNSLIGRISADPNEQTFEYDRAKEILAWPVAMAQAAGVGYGHNWDWGIRRNTFVDAFDDRSKMPDDFELAMCPADRVRISTPFYPRGDSLRGTGDPDDPFTGDENTAYWGYLSYGINEDIVGTEARERDNKSWPACWKDGARGESNRPNWEKAGERLRGNMDRVYNPSTCLLIVDAGPNTVDEALGGEYAVDHATGLGYANLITSAQAFGPYLRDSTAQWMQRIPTKRHPGGAINVVFADLHASSVLPSAWWFNETIQQKVPATYAPAVRVSPYRPFEQ